MYILTSTFDIYLNSLMRRQERKTALAYIYQFIKDFKLANKELERVYLELAGKAYKVANATFVFGKREKLEKIRSDFNHRIQGFS